MHYILIVLAVLILAAILYSPLENRNLEVTHYSISSDKLPKEFDGISFAVLADLHNNSFGKGNKKLLDCINQIAPQFLLIAGDMTVSEEGNDYTVPYSLLSELAGTCPIYYGYGNHEQRLMPGGEKQDLQFMVYKRELEKLGVHFLENEQTRITLGNSPSKGKEVPLGKEFVQLTGLLLPPEFFKKIGRPRMTTEYLQNLVGIPDNGCYNILIAHNPMYFKNYAEWGADLTLSGHVHGGIVRLPFLGGVLSPQFTFFPRYDAGKFEIQGRTMLVSRGLGNHTIKLRVCNRPELMVVTLERKL